MYLDRDQDASALMASRQRRSFHVLAKLACKDIFPKTVKQNEDETLTAQP